MAVAAMRAMRAMRAVLSPSRWTLSTKLCAGLALVAVIGMTLGALTLDRAIRPAFTALERDAVAEQIARSETLLQSTQSQVLSSATDYAVWDDSYFYIAQQNSAFEQENLTTLGLVNLGIDAIVYARFDGTLLNALYIDREAEEADPQRSAAFGALLTSPRFRALARSQSSFSEFTRVDGRIYAVGAAQVFRSDGSGTPTGYVVMARHLNDAFASEALQIPARMTGALEAQTWRAGDAWHVAVPLTDAAGDQIGTLQYAIPREATQIGTMSIATALAASFVVMVGVLIAVLLLMRLVVVRRLETVTHHVRSVAANGDLTPLAADPAGDELGSLNRSFNAMIAQLRELREQVKEQSFLLGQSDLAASVIHNVRNALNPVSLTIAYTLAEKTLVANEDVGRALSELQAGDATPERRARLTEFLRLTFSEEQRRAELRHEAMLGARAALSESLEILRLQNEAVTREIPLERFDVLDIIKRNAATARFAPWDRVVIEVPAEGGEIVANRLLLSQVIATLMTRALDSIVTQHALPGRLVIALSCEEAGEQSLTRIVLHDDGCGFEPSEAAKLFERAQSPSLGGHGLDLHWCANTVRAMGGSLVLESDGPGKGARAVLSLPSARKAKDAKTHDAPQRPAAIPPSTILAAPPIAVASGAR